MTEELKQLRRRVEKVERLERERSLADTALRESEERLRDFAAAASDWFWEMDAELRFSFMSERLREVTGVDPHAIIGKTRLDVGAGDTDAEKWQAHLDDLKAHLPFRDFRYVYVGEDDERQYWSISGVPLFGEDGVFLGYRGTGRNLTEEYRARRMAFEAQDLLLQAIEHFSSAVALFDSEDRLMLFNEAFLENVGPADPTVGPGMSFEELVRRQVERGIIPAAEGREEEWIIERLERHRNPTEEFEVGRADGRWLRMREERTGNGGVFLTATDITETKVIERAEQDIRDRLRAVIDHLPAGLVLKDKTGVHLLANQQFMELYGFQEPGVIGGTAYDLFPLAEADLISQQDQTVLRTGIPMEAEREITRLDGEKLVCMITRFPVLDSNSQAIGIGGIHMNISEMKEKEKELRVARDDAERANHAKSAFLANMSHELRTPLNAIIGFSEIMERGLFGALGNPQYEEYAEDIRRSASHLLSIISDILDLSKIEAGRMDLHEEEIDLAAAVKSCQSMILESAVNAGLTTRASVPAGLPPLFADKRSVRQILINLLSNSVKFTPEGGIITVEIRLEPNGELALVVRDTGIGMSADDIEVVLQPFGQVESAHTRSHNGTGLGLPITRSLAEIHGGSLTVESEVGGGTTITVRFPAERVGGVDSVKAVADHRSRNERRSA
ncbi:MAG: ATP-binding protein [Kiloniellaceae bacterium]